MSGFKVQLRAGCFLTSDVAGAVELVLASSDGHDKEQFLTMVIAELTKQINSPNEQIKET